MARKHNSGYLACIFEPNRFRATVDSIVEALRKIDPMPDAIACTGASGMLMAGAVSVVTGIPILLVRKLRDDSHFTAEMRTNVEGPLQVTSYVILDDFVNSGHTIERIQAEIRSERGDHTGCAAMLMYAIAPAMLRNTSKSKIARIRSQLNGAELIACGVEPDELDTPPQVAR